MSYDDPDAKAFYERAVKECQAGGKQSMKNIVEQVSRSRGVPVKDIMGTSRLKDIVAARQSAMWLSRSQGISFARVGRFFNRDHTTILHACNKIDGLIRSGSV